MERAADDEVVAEKHHPVLVAAYQGHLLSPARQAESAADFRLLMMAHDLTKVTAATATAWPPGA